MKPINIRDHKYREITSMKQLDETIKWFEQIVKEYEGKISTVSIFRDKLQILRAKRAERIGK